MAIETFSYPASSCIQRALSYLVSTQRSSLKNLAGWIMSATTEADIWERIMHPTGKMSKKAARAILKLSFRADDQRRMRELAAKNKASVLTADEELELDHFCRVGRTLTILKSRARKVLKNGSHRE